MDGSNERQSRFLDTFEQYAKNEARLSLELFDDALVNLELWSNDQTHLIRAFRGKNLNGVEKLDFTNFCETLHIAKNKEVFLQALSKSIDDYNLACAHIGIQSFKKSRDIKGPVQASLLLKLVNYLTPNTLQHLPKNFKKGVTHTENTTFIKKFNLIPVISSIKIIPKNSPELFTELKSDLEVSIRLAGDLGDSAKEVQRLLSSVISMKKSVDNLEKNFFFETLCDFVNLERSPNFGFREVKEILSPRKKEKKYRNSKQRRSSLTPFIETAARENLSGRSSQENFSSVYNKNFFQRTLSRSEIDSASEDHKANELFPVGAGSSVSLEAGAFECYPNSSKCNSPFASSSGTFTARFDLDSEHLQGKQLQFSDLSLSDSTNILHSSDHKVSGGIKGLAIKFSESLAKNLDQMSQLLEEIKYENQSFLDELNMRDDL